MRVRQQNGLIEAVGLQQLLGLQGALFIVERAGLNTVKTPATGVSYFDPHRCLHLVLNLSYQIFCRKVAGE